jgi:5'-nucleotidase
MKLLVTNDDGIESVFLHELVAALRQAGHELFVAAPKNEQSWIGAAKSRNRPVHSREQDCGLGCRTWIIDGTPSDCVNIAIAHLLPCKPDAVVSGINIGLNATLGFILASGTIGGAWEGAVHGLPAVAVSQDLSYATFEQLKRHGCKPDEALVGTLRITSARVAGLLPDLLSSAPPQSFVVHNLNFPFPCQPDTPIVRTIPAQVIVPGLFSPAADDGTHRFIFSQGRDVSPAGPLTDRAALLNGQISHTVLDYRALGKWEG